MVNNLISVIIPVYNSSRYLEKTLVSVLNQSHKNLDIICVDDASEDGSLEILQKYASKDPRIHLVRHSENKGRLEARRSGVNNAKGDTIMFLDSDDTMDLALCKSVLKALTDNDVDIVQFPANQINIETGMSDIILPPLVRLSGDDIQKVYYVTREVPVSLCMRIFRSELIRRAFDQIPNFRSDMGEDVLVSYFISYYSNSYLGINTRARYNYYLGRGISSGRNISLDKFKKYCEMSLISTTVLDFVRKEQVSDSAAAAAEHMSIRLLSDCCSAFDLVPDEEKDEAVDMFWKYWNEVPNVNRYVLYAFASQKRYIDGIYESESYKLGNSIVRKMRNIRTAISAKKSF